MNKTRIIAIQCLCVFVMFLGVWWWVDREYTKTHPAQVWKTVENPEMVKVYRGKWHREYLEVMK